VNLNQSKKLYKNELIAIASITLVVLLSFFILEKWQDSVNRKQELLNKEFAVHSLERQKIISDGVENFIPTPGETEWPGCATFNYNPTVYEMGYCDGSRLAQSQNEIANGRSDQKIMLSYPELVTSGDDSLYICNLATDSGQWEGTEIGGKYPFYEMGKFDITNVKDKSQYIAGCEMGIKKYFDFGQQLLTATLSAQQRRKDKQNQEVEALKPVDTNSREYITGLTIGNNFSNFSDAGAIAEKVCKTARDRRIVLSSTGGVGVDPKTASYLNSKDGLQGCIDGFNGVPQD